ncbi:MAG: DUF6316 family protein [Gammaproteobacteria bacterium]
MNTRHDEPPRLRFRSERFFRTTEGWFFQTREGFNIGPYTLLQQARTDAESLIARLKATPAADARAVIEDFIQHRGWDLDTLHDPAFGRYPTAESMALQSRSA